MGLGKDIKQNICDIVHKTIRIKAEEVVCIRTVYVCKNVILLLIGKEENNKIKLSNITNIQTTSVSTFSFTTPPIARALT